MYQEAMRLDPGAQEVAYNYGVLCFDVMEDFPTAHRLFLNVSFFVFMSAIGSEFGVCGCENGRVRECASQLQVVCLGEWASQLVCRESARLNFNLSVFICVIKHAGLRSSRIHAHAHVRAYLHAHQLSRTHTRAHTRRHEHAHTHAHAHTHSHKHKHTHTHTHTHAYAHTRARTRTRTHTRARTRTCTCMRIHTGTGTRTRRWLRKIRGTPTQCTPWLKSSSTLLCVITSMRIASSNAACNA